MTQLQSEAKYQTQLTDHLKGCVLQLQKFISMMEVLTLAVR